MMVSRPTLPLIASLALALALVAGCADDGHSHGPGGDHTHGPAPDEPEAPDDPEDDHDHVDVPPAVRRNLGIVFAPVERRAVSRTLRVPGSFELLPDARREYRTMLTGQVELLVKELDVVEIGTPLYVLDSPQWREIQRLLTSIEAEIDRAEARMASFGPLLAAHEQHDQSLDDLIGVWEERAARLEEVARAGGPGGKELADARAAIATHRSELAQGAEKVAQLEAQRREAEVDVASARSRRELLCVTACSLLGLEPEELESAVEENGQRLPRWRTIHRIVVRARRPGVVERLALANGSWADETSLVLTTAELDRLRFHAEGLQSDLSRLAEGLPAQVVAARGAPVAPAAGPVMSGALRLGVEASSSARTIDLFVEPEELASWARPGVAAHLEITLEGTDAPQLAIPLAAVQRDGLVPVFFRRDPDDPDLVHRVEADLGLDDGRWIVVNEGVSEGDWIVVEGVYPLVLASSDHTADNAGGHVHPDGTVHGAGE